MNYLQGFLMSYANGVFLGLGLITALWIAKHAFHFTICG